MKTRMSGTGSHKVYQNVGEDFHIGRKSRGMGEHVVYFNTFSIFNVTRAEAARTLKLWRRYP